MSTTGCPYDYTGDDCSQTLGQATAHQWVAIRWIHFAVAVFSLGAGLVLLKAFATQHAKLMQNKRRRYENQVSSTMRVLSAVTFILHSVLNGIYWALDPNRVSGDQVWSSAWERAAHFLCCYYSFDWSILTSGFALQAMWAITPEQQVSTWRRFKLVTVWIALVEGVVMTLVVLYDAQELTQITLLRVYLTMHNFSVFGFAGSSLYGGYVLIRYVNSLPAHSVSEQMKQSVDRAKAHRNSFGPIVVIFVLFTFIFAPTALLATPAGWTVVSVYLPLAPDVGKIGHVQLLGSLVQKKKKKPDASTEGSPRGSKSVCSMASPDTSHAQA